MCFSLFQKRKLIIRGSKGKKKELLVEIADNFFKRAIGLMFRNSLKQNEGMLFIFPEEKRRSFWMMFTKIPLDAIFFNSDKKIVEIIQMKTCNINCPSYTSKKKAKYVLEVNAYYYRKNKLKAGLSFKLL